MKLCLKYARLFFPGHGVYKVYEAERDKMSQREYTLARVIRLIIPASLWERHPAGCASHVHDELMIIVTRLLTEQALPFYDHGSAGPTL